MLSQLWRCSWSSADRRCSNYIWVINNSIAYKGVTYTRGFTVVVFQNIFISAPEALHIVMLIYTQYLEIFWLSGKLVFKCSSFTLNPSDAYHTLVITYYQLCKMQLTRMASMVTCSSFTIDTCDLPIFFHKDHLNSTCFSVNIKLFRHAMSIVYGIFQTKFCPQILSTCHEKCSTQYFID